MSVFAVIPARGGSKSIPNKNMYLLNGVPLIEYTIEACRRSKSIDQFVVSTDSQLIIDYCIKNSLTYVLRPAHLALDTSQHFLAFKCIF